MSSCDCRECDARAEQRARGHSANCIYGVCVPGSVGSNFKPRTESVDDAEVRRLRAMLTEQGANYEGVCEEAARLRLKVASERDLSEKATQLSGEYIDRGQLRIAQLEADGAAKDKALAGLRAGYDALCDDHTRKCKTISSLHEPCGACGYAGGSKVPDVGEPEPPIVRGALDEQARLEKLLGKEKAASRSLARGLEGAVDDVAGLRGLLESARSDAAGLRAAFRGLANEIHSLTTEPTA